MLPENPNEGLKFDKDNLKEIYLAGGCFWGVESFLERIYGVYKTDVGYANGDIANPTYEEVCKGSSHAEAVHVVYDTQRISLEKIIDEFFKIIDPTSFNKQGADKGKQYRTGIYYLNNEDKEIAENKIIEYTPKYDMPILVEVKPLENYYKAEKYHQKYLEKNPNGYCHINLNILNKK